MRISDYAMLALVTVLVIAITPGLCTNYEKTQTKPKEEAAPASVRTEIPVGTIKCVKPGYKYCREYRIFRETNQ